MHDFVVIGSGFGGSVSALRLAEKGYTVLVLEKGRRFHKEDFPHTNWNVRQWLWNPKLGLRGFFQMSFLRHVTVLHGVGVGGGSLVYANTLPTPTSAFFSSGPWAKLASWEEELSPFYETAKKMLGSIPYPGRTRGDEVLRDVGIQLGRKEAWNTTNVAVYFGEPGKQVSDPYFAGAGPSRTGCTDCGACMTGCRVGAKNTLDQNYLYLAETKGATVLPDSEVIDVRPTEKGYVVELSSGRIFQAQQVIFAGGVMGTVPLLLRLRRTSLPLLSSRVGKGVRTNSEALIGVLSPDSSIDFSTGVAITSELHTGENSHVETVRYGRGSGFFRLLALPHAPQSTLLGRLGGIVAEFARSPWRWLRAFTVRDFAKQAQILLYMRPSEGTLAFREGGAVSKLLANGLASELEDGAEAPKAFMTEATDIARRFAAEVKGVVVGMFTETMLGTPTTAHILGGACMGESSEEGVIDSQHRVHGYEGLYVIDGSAISSNPGVNPSLTITALAERAMSKIPMKV